MFPETCLSLLVVAVNFFFLTYAQVYFLVFHLNYYNVRSGVWHVSFTHQCIIKSCRVQSHKMILNFSDTWNWSWILKLEWNYFEKYPNYFHYIPVSVFLMVICMFISKTRTQGHCEFWEYKKVMFLLMFCFFFSKMLFDRCMYTQQHFHGSNVFITSVQWWKCKVRTHHLSLIY